MMDSREYKLTTITTITQ